jgi:prevent-host-death family protein
MGGKTRREYLRTIHPRYRKADRQQRQLILYEFCSNCGNNRKYAIRRSTFQSAHSTQGGNTMAKMTAVQARDRFSDLVSRAVFQKEETIITRRSKPVAAVVPIEALALIEEMKDRLDAEEADRILENTKPEDWIRWKQVKQELGIR